ncbi:MAG: hypothetical protein LBF90_01885, partial [Prevotellaceae bacterium]|nr:hypothetical protein [Prevotellaceae bacterium]
MRKIFLYPLLFLCLTPVFGQSIEVEIQHLGANYSATPPTVTFEVFWDAAPTSPRHRDTVWLFVDVQPINPDNSVGAWRPATITAVAPPLGAGTVIPSSLNGRGFYLDGHTGAVPFSSTLTVSLSPDLNGAKFNWCAYASDYPPNATEGAGHYVLHGTPPFVVNGDTLAPGVRAFTGCIDVLTDATGCPGLVPARPVVTAFVATPDTICAGDTAALTATATGASEYSFDGGQTWQAAPTARVAPTSDTTYNIYVRNGAGCTVTATTAIKVYPMPVPAFVSAPDTVCSGSVVTVVAGGGASYCFTHTCEGCAHNPYHTGNDTLPEFECRFSGASCSYSSSGTYRFTIPDGGSTVWVRVMSEHGCLDSISTFIAVGGKPTPPALSGGVYCGSGALSLWGLSGYSYQLVNPVNSQSEGAEELGAGAPIYFPFTLPGTYSYAVRITELSSGCTNTSSPQTLHIHPEFFPGSIDAGSDTVCYGASV